jgi:hypothetical protein
MRINHLIDHFDKTYTFGGFNVGLTINEDCGTSDADIFIIKRGEIYQCNFYYADGFTGSVDLELESRDDVIEITMPESVQTKLKDWLYANGY